MYLISGLIMLLQTAISIFIYLFLLRFLLQKLGANYFNQVIQLLVKLTDFAVKPIRKIIPSFKGYDLGILLIVFVLQIFSVLLLVLFKLPNVAALWGVLIIIIAQIGGKFINIYFFAIIIQAIASWIPALQAGPFIEVVYLITEPVMKYARRWVPPIAGFDLSPIPVLIALRLIDYIVFNPLLGYGLTQV